MSQPAGPRVILEQPWNHCRPGGGHGPDVSLYAAHLRPDSGLLSARPRSHARDVQTGPATATLEVGCGTARNLVRLARRSEPGCSTGLDASHEMLETAAASIARTGERQARKGGRRSCSGRGWPNSSTPARCLAASGRSTPSSSRIASRWCPTWPVRSMPRSTTSGPAATLLIVDFWISGICRDGSRRASSGGCRYSTFTTGPRCTTPWSRSAGSGRADVTFEPVARRYAYIATLRKS